MCPCPWPGASLLAKAARTSIDVGHAFREVTTGWKIVTSSLSAPTPFDSGRSVEGYLREALRIAHGQGEIMQHAMALGLSVAGMGGKNPEAFDDLNSNQTLFTDSAVTGETAASGYAMGFVLTGNADVASADEMLTYARKTA